MPRKRSPAATVSMVLMAWALVAQVIGSLAYWFYITRGDPTILVIGLAFGGGVAGLLGVPFVAVAIVLAALGRFRPAGIISLIGGLVSAISIVAVAAAMFALFSPEGRAVATDAAPEAHAASGELA